MTLGVKICAPVDCTGAPRASPAELTAIEPKLKVVVMGTMLRPSEEQQFLTPYCQYLIMPRRDTIQWYGLGFYLRAHKMLRNK